MGKDFLLIPFHQAFIDIIVGNKWGSILTINLNLKKSKPLANELKLSQSHLQLMLSWCITKG